MNENKFNKHLIVIDMQNDFLTGALPNKDAVAILPKVIDKVNKAREQGDIQVSWTLDSHHENYLETQEGQKLPIAHCLEGTWGHKLADGLDPKEDEVQFWKGTFGSIGMAQDIKRAIEERWLNGHSNDDDPNPRGKNVEIELVGICTDICVISNAMVLKATMPEAKIVVDASCCAGMTPQSHRRALEAMKMCQIEVINDEDDRGSSDSQQNECVNIAGVEITD